MAEFLYSKRIVVSVEKCYSACIVVLAGAISRQYLEGSDVRIHRIFPTDVKQFDNYEKFVEEEGKWYETLSQFFRRYGVSSEIVEKMRTIPSSELKIVSIRELETLGLGSRNVRYEDELRFQISRSCGVGAYSRFRDNNDNEILKRCAPGFQ